MLWIDYSIESFADGSFAVKGEWPGEVMGKGADGERRDHYLYKPGDVFVVNEYGILKKIDEVNALLLKHETNREDG
jgi:hypothetical protein|tara:strand:+ start:450 stop:677 length:228 start_codon:yes stop_codon:yes gene_type:complete